ncbi:glycosyltransferase family 2 protein [Bacteroides fragilis]|uniref:glycosyltransferase family 2 protein n=1 Tax=Bacteroides fragilis TaxID=817 RepID=UPI0020309D42|nr:glycosyltransferase family 2 protein [Bacteroides fragilis]MCM0237091.1 glycosyltransferase family 2 protein [Bacteroides fragilis]
MLVSIIIPVYKVEKYILRCLNSIVEQTFNDIECIIVNDFTPDNSMELVKSFVENYHGDICFNLIEHVKNEGLSVARNTGIKYAKGDYVFFLDSDDELPPDSIELLCKPLDLSTPDLIVGNVSVIGQSTLALMDLNKVKGRYENRETINYLMLSGCLPTMGCNKLIKRSFILDNHLFFKPHVLHEDVHWLFFCAKKVSDLYVIPDTTYIYHMNVGSITNTKSMKNIESLYVIIEDLLHDFDTNNHIHQKYIMSEALLLLEYVADISERVVYESYRVKLKAMLYPIVTQYIHSFNLKQIFRLLPFFLSYTIYKYVYRFIFDVVMQIQLFLKK